MMSNEHKKFTINDKADTIYFQREPNALRVAFLVVSEYFETPQDAVTDKLRLICDTLNKEP